MSLQAKLDAIRRNFEKMTPPHRRAVIHRTTEALVDSGQAERSVPEGSPVPRFSLPDRNGGRWTLESALHRGPLVLTFFRGNW
jgi:hypothetical protein